MPQMLPGMSPGLRGEGRCPQCPPCPMSPPGNSARPAQVGGGPTPRSTLSSSCLQDTSLKCAGKCECEREKTGTWTHTHHAPGQGAAPSFVLIPVLPAWQVCAHFTDEHPEVYKV